MFFQILSNSIGNQYIPDYVSSPGKTLLEAIEEHGISQEDFAEQISISQEDIYKIINGKSPITNELAIQLEQVLDIPSSFWNNRERNYQIFLEQQLELPRFEPNETNPQNMNQQPIKPKQPGKPNYQEKTIEPDNRIQSMDIVEEIVKTINGLKDGLKTYPIRELVKHAEKFGPYLRAQRLETNQVRKFLDAVNRLKADLAEKGDFSKIETEVVLLKPKLAYAAARQKAAKPLGEVISAAIDKVHSKEDFERLVQLVESTIAYHKAEGGK